MNGLRLLALCAVLGGLGIHVLLLFAPWRERPVSRESAKALEIRYFPENSPGSDQALRQHAVLFDSAPLFMPTRWNSANRFTSVPTLREATDFFILYPARVRLSPEAPTVFDTEASLPSTPPGFTELNILPPWLLAQYGQKPLRGVDVAGGQGTVRLQRLSGSGDSSAYELLLPEDILALAPTELWQTATFYLQLHHGLASGRAILGQSSGFPAWDQTLAAYFSSARFARRMPNGYFQIRVYP